MLVFSVKIKLQCWYFQIKLILLSADFYVVVFRALESVIYVMKATSYNTLTVDKINYIFYF